MTSQSKWVILGKPECGWCTKAIALLEKHDVEYSYFNLVNCGNLRAFVLASGLTTVPQVYLNGQRIGGYEELEQWINIMYPTKKDQLDLPL